MITRWDGEVPRVAKDIGRFRIWEGCGGVVG